MTEFLVGILGALYRPGHDAGAEMVQDCCDFAVVCSKRHDAMLKKQSNRYGCRHGVVLPTCNVHIPAR